ncbi:probable phosphoenolpyruvate synthase [Caerostris extrusa]|uniref:Probable phosphoenolpyruvate synthase n=1 Tax=Caerostris extrusa TaxID=172846 RepID=A0AAV4P556_CAEEX|nr:probable phosphoenolpyruvate synthase [Caerostris extrusa]
MDEINNAFVLKCTFGRDIQKAFADRKPDQKFAVRSSSTGEDTEQMSAAGQMDTYLGVSLDEVEHAEQMLTMLVDHRLQIRPTSESCHSCPKLSVTLQLHNFLDYTAIKKCWASQFSYIAVQYKRQNGQEINSPMAVVVQEMVSCDVAGVLFTCDPLTGNPNSMMITANYGLGESVVSGSEEPDTIEIQRQEDGTLDIKNTIIGSKSHRIILKVSLYGVVEDVSDHKKQVCCLSDTMALRLAQIAVKLERSFGSHRDIEWGFWNNNLYIFNLVLLQAEPKKLISKSIMSSMQAFAVKTITSPCATSEVLMKFCIAFQRRVLTVGLPKSRLAKYFLRGIVSMYYHVMFYCVDLFQHIKEDASRTQATSVGLFGRIIEDEELFEIARERFANSQLKKDSSFKESLRRICAELTPVMVAHMFCSESSSLLNMIIFITLQKATGEINADVYNDFARLLTTSSGVESADVPAAMEHLAFCIFQDIESEKFKNMETEEALQWLETSSTNASKKYREFLEKHGHRCLREFDIRSFTWRTDPKTLVKLLQNLVGSVKSDRVEKKQDDINKLISDVKAPLSFKTRLLLRIILPLSQKAVQNRECSKSTLIRALNEWRKGYRKLARKMVSEGRIPDEDLLFFMSFEEIDELLDTRSPKIISKANHRRRRYRLLDRYIFPEIMKGFPKPINADKKIVVSTDENFSMKGIPVSQGEVTVQFV